MMPFWRPFAVVAIVLLFSPLPGEQHFRLSGLLLQLAGLATVAHGLNVTRAVFDQRSVPTALRDVLTAFGAGLSERQRKTALRVAND